MAAHEPAQLVDLAPQRLGLGEHRAGAAATSSPASVGWTERVVRRSSSIAELALEPPDLVRERRLRDVELVGRVREVPVADDRLEVAQLRMSTAYRCDIYEIQIHASHMCVASMNHVRHTSAPMTATAPSRS